MSTVQERSPDVVIVATGAIPLVPPIAGVDCPQVATAWEVLQGRVVGQRVLVIGGGMTGLETAEFLARGGREVVVVEQLKRAGADMGATVRWHLMNRTRDLNIRIFTSTQVREIMSGGVVVVSRKGSEETWSHFDSVVLACGSRPRDELSANIKDLVAQVYVIGDAAKPRRGLEAIREGSETGRRI
jgi:pyruvate/2-oxoglutarate dehydrogenase complex dihydrolipoamide dehydrogenase (E3) component